MINTTYLSESQIKRIANICNEIYSKANKTRLKEIGTKYGLTYDQTRLTNMNMFWQLATDELKKDPKAIDKISLLHISDSLKEGNFMSVREMVLDYINEKYENDYKFLCTFDPEQPINQINEIIRFSGLRLNLTIAELLQIDNYEKYFNSKFGIQAADQKAVKATKRVSKFFDELLEGVPNREGFFVAVGEYLKDNDLTAFHNKLHAKND